MPVHDHARGVADGMREILWLLGAGALLTLVDASADEAPRSAATTVLGKATSFVEGPIADAYYIDYAALLNEHYGRGVTVENNANVLLLQVQEPDAVEEEIRAAYFQALGFDVPPEGRDRFVPYS